MINISVIIPVKGMEHVIGRAIDSLVKQDTKLSFEAIFMVHPSSDKTIEIISNYQKDHPNFKMIMLPDGPFHVSTARIIGIKQSSGEYIMFLDADDYYHKDMMEKMYKAVKDNDAKMAMCSYYYVKDKGIRKTSFASNKILSRNVALKKLMRDISIHGFYWNKIYNGEFLRTADIKMPNEEMVREDLYTNFVLMMKIDKLVTIKDPLYYYDKTNSILTTQVNKKRIPWFLNIMAYERKAIEEDGDIKLKKIFFNLSLMRRILIMGDELILKKGYSKEEYKALKKNDRKLLKVINNKKTFISKDMPWEEFLNL